MLVVRTRAELAAARSTLPGPIGLTATMGALHAGHVALVSAARAECQSVVASIFVNPTQFADAATASAYPRDEAGDLRTLETAGCDVAWLPGVEDIYPDGDATMVEVAGPALGWEGTHRPGHFRGMATVVAKLFGLVRPDLAYFGEKDWQQLQVVQRMVRDLLLPVTIRPVPTVREKDGLAMSSRNRFLSPAERMIAPRLYACLAATAERLRAGEPVRRALADATAELAALGFGVDYLALVNGAMQETEEITGARLIATARLGPVRLLDNLGLD